MTIFRTPDGQLMATRAAWQALLTSCQATGQRTLARKLGAWLQGQQGDIIRLRLSADDVADIIAADQRMTEVRPLTLARSNE